MIFLGGKADSIEEGFEISKEKISSGEAYDRFLQMSELQNGDISFLKNPEKYEQAKFAEKVFINKKGFVKVIDTYKIGVASSKLGAGRIRKEDKIDPKAGIIFHPKIGDEINSKTLIAEIFSDKKNEMDEAKKMISDAVEVSEKKTKRPKLIKKIIQ